MAKKLPAQIKVAVIGDGIAGSGAACNLAKFVRTEIVML